MYRIALKMLIEDKAKYIGLILSISFSTIIIMQQSAIFFGLIRRTYGAISDTPQADIWIMDPSVLMIDDIKPLRDTDLYRVRSITGVEWAVPFYKGLIRARLPDGTFQTCILIGIDDATLIGGPHTMLSGSLEMLRRPDAIIVNKVGAEDKLAKSQGAGKPKIPLAPGDTLELNDKRAEVVGICDVSRTFQSQPFIYTTYNRAVSYAPAERKTLSFILVKSASGVSSTELCKKIAQQTHLAAYTKNDFEQKTVDYYMENTGIPINFGIAVLLGLFLGAAIAGQIFYNFISDNLTYLALFTAMGASPNLLARMTLLQALWVALIGWGIGSGAASMIGFLASKTELSFFLPWQLFLGTGALMLLICFLASLIGIQKIYNIDLATILKR
jgi:putative ABC transport system permease protein